MYFTHLQICNQFYFVFTYNIILIYFSKVEKKIKKYVILNTTADQYLSRTDF